MNQVVFLSLGTQRPKLRQEDCSEFQENPGYWETLSRCSSRRPEFSTLHPYQVTYTCKGPQASGIWRHLHPYTHAAPTHPYTIKTKLIR